MSAFINPPERIPFYLKIGIWFAEKIAGKEMLPARLLAWYPKAAIGSGVLESLTAHGRDDAEKRLLRLVRLQAAFELACPFCVDMNAFEFEKHGVSTEEFTALQTSFQTGFPPTFSLREKTALEYARLISATPLVFPNDLMKKLKSQFSERETVMLAATASQVNYWARLVQSLGTPPVGFSHNCDLPNNFQEE